LQNSTTEDTERQSRNQTFLPQRAQSTQRKPLRRGKSFGICNTESEEIPESIDNSLSVVSVVSVVGVVLMS